jgi:hypothetical protein
MVPYRRLRQKKTQGFMYGLRLLSCINDIDLPTDRKNMDLINGSPMSQRRRTQYPSVSQACRRRRRIRHQLSRCIVVWIFAWCIHHAPCSRAALQHGSIAGRIDHVPMQWLEFDLCHVPGHAVGRPPAMNPWCRPPIFSSKLDASLPAGNKKSAGGSRKQACRLMVL